MDGQVHPWQQEWQKIQKENSENLSRQLWLAQKFNLNAVLLSNLFLYTNLSIDPIISLASFSL